MAFINIKKSLESQGSVQTIQQVGVYNPSETHVFQYNFTGAKKTNSVFVQPSYIIYDYMPVIGGELQMERNYLITTVVNEFIRARAANTSLARYDATDIAKWLIAAGGINALVAEIKRGMKAYYLGKNTARQMRQAGVQTIPAYLNTFSINGFTDIANLRIELNRVLQKLNGIKVPKGIPFIDYWFKLSSKMFKESTNDKAANFYFRALAVPVWDVNGVFGNIGNIVYKNLSSSTTNKDPNDLKTMINLLNTLADMYTTDEDVNNMFAEFQKANMSDVYELKELTEADLLTGLDFEVNLDIIYAVKNARIVGMDRSQIISTRIIEGTSTAGGLKLSYDSDNFANHFGFNPSYAGDYNRTQSLDYYSGALVDMIYSCHKDEMNNSENVNALQLTAVTAVESSATSGSVRSAGLAIIVGMFIATSLKNNDIQLSNYIAGNKFVDLANTDNTSGMLTVLLNTLKIANICDFLQFTAIPTLYFMGNPSSGTPTATQFIDDSDNSIIINMDVAEKVQDAIVLSSVSYEK